jgi:hypothetical protein
VWCRHHVSRLNSTVDSQGNIRLQIAKSFKQPFSDGHGLLSKTFVHHDSLGACLKFKEHGEVGAVIARIGELTTL